MTYNKLKFMKIALAFLILLLIVAAFIIGNYYLAFWAFIVGLLFLVVGKAKYKKMLVDERTTALSGLAARLTVLVSVTVMIGFSLLFILVTKRSQDVFMEALAVVFSYVALMQLAVYSLSYYIASRWPQEGSK